ncbi:putative oxidoreductase, short chain dehydrogenase/reductase family protein [Blattamonas nauphoetae]|uniref:Oxidoreductase, short chain dehydrogenase/reductase family protein n=1 Tax=Blattamonas nauphoetae TaxID=2049346 RepID=A0ABQ9XHS3_9EUKA|nr:putative oxidoreductase, short chain dehydrogenase/reductase family protein [Blattamonas nauphoetae]
MENSITDAQLKAALEVLQSIEANPEILRSEDMKSLKKSIGHIFTTIHKDDFLQSSSSKHTKIDLKATQKQDALAKQSSLMIQQRKQAKSLIASQPMSILNSTSEGQIDIFEEPVRTSSRPCKCYVCQEEYTSIHFFYHSLCPSCAALNWEKRFSCGDLRGKIALCTGARVKIGHQCCLRLLHSGAFVIATSRFPNDAALRFLADTSFETYAHRLHIFGLDFRDLSSVQAFSKFIMSNYPRLDILVNNAAQTIRKPASFYTHLIEGEMKQLNDLPKEAVELRKHDPQYSASVPEENNAFAKVNNPKNYFDAYLSYYPTDQEPQAIVSDDGPNHQVRTVTNVTINGTVHNLYSSARPVTLTNLQSTSTLSAHEDSLHFPNISQSGTIFKAGCVVSSE